MLYLSIDQHAKQITVVVRNEAGDNVLRRQVSTRPEKIKLFFEQLVEMDTEFMAILECCGFNDWLIEELRKYKCQEIVLIHPDKPSKKKTDRRDARKLCDLLWVNRDRLAGGKLVHDLRRVYITSQQEKDDRQITALRQGLGQRLTRVTNKIQRILHRHNLMWNYPTKVFRTKTGRAWLEQLELPEVDRLELDFLLQEWKTLDEHIEQVKVQIAERANRSDPKCPLNAAQILMTAPGVGHYTALGIASRIGDIDRFPRPRSLANYFGLTPGCRNSGNSNRQPGAITREGSRFVRFVLGQLVLHFLKHDPKMRDWYRRIKLRRGSKIARMAVMRRIATVFWHMLKHRERYTYGGPPPRLRKSNPHHRTKKNAACLANCNYLHQTPNSEASTCLQMVSYASRVLPLPRAARHLCPRQSRGPGRSTGMAGRCGPRTLGGLRFSGEATAAIRTAPRVPLSQNNDK